MTYREVIQHEPRIAKALGRYKPSRSSRQNHRRYEAAKARLAVLVGHGAETPEVATTQAHEIVIQELARRLRV